MTARALAARATRPAPSDAGASDRRDPDARSFRHKFGLLVPATNTTAEHDLWDIVHRSRVAGGLHGIGLVTFRVSTPAPQLRTNADRVRYGRQFLAGLAAAGQAALLARPDSLILGMSVEHVVAGLAGVRAPVAELHARTGLPVAAWHDAIATALRRLGARRVGLLTPFDRSGTASAARMFAELGFDVVASVGLACPDARLIAHVPEWAKERAILELVATDGHRMDAVVQCGTNMSVLDVAERLEPQIGIPILGINPVTLWHALRARGITEPLARGGRLTREY